MMNSIKSVRFSNTLFSVIFFLSAVLFFAGCGKTRTGSETISTSGLPEIELDHQFTITDSDTLILQQIAGVETDSEGRIYLTDDRALQIHVFDRNGDFITSIGREGSGPGEFQSLLRVFIGPNDRLFANDVRQLQTTIFAEENGSWEIEDIFVNDTGNRYTIQSAGAGGELILRQSPPQSPEPGAYWYEHELATGRLESGLVESGLHHLKDMGLLVSQDLNMYVYPFSPTTIVTATRDGKLYLVWNEQFEMAVLDLQLHLVDSVSAPIAKQPVTNQEREEALERFPSEIRALGREHMPETKPVIRNLFVDGNENLWLQTYDSPEYLVLNRRGDPLGSFDLPEGLALSHADENRIYATRTDGEAVEVHVFNYSLSD